MTGPDQTSPHRHAQTQARRHQPDVLRGALHRAGDGGHGLALGRATAEVGQVGLRPALMGHGIPFHAGETATATAMTALRRRGGMKVTDSGSSTSSSMA